ncbi:MAG: 1-(5-phosphoribosyl)-5-[Clostridia bacterium]|nr:1-(5-phosphoribosyl)-5-[(5-phosphoribosylamino)methylideneamino]imidazole-4-carboxamide isomerase [Clostridia bacterium]
MNLFPAIDLYDSSAVRLYKGDYDQMTFYSRDPLSFAKTFEEEGCEYLHTVDLAAARDGVPKELDLISRITEETALKVQVGGGVRSMDVVESYLKAGVFRVVLGTAAVTDEAFLKAALSAYKERIAIGLDIKDGKVAIRGWRETSDFSADAFLEKLVTLGAKCVICTDISRDGAMQGANCALYKRLNEQYPIDFIASGGVSTLSDLAILKDSGLYGAILGKAYYTGAVTLRDALEVCR